jgi:2,3-bisphosphoglycerate-independent phosphoglycerate mutase
MLSAMTDKLAPHPTLSTRPGPIVLCILDGVGVGRGGEDDAVSSARTPNLTRLRNTGLHRTLRAHGVAVGMPSDDDLGNSEVGHNAMGAGRIFDQGAKLVEIAMNSGDVFETDCWKDLARGKTLHFIGLVSDGNVHSHIDHLEAMIQRAVQDGVKRVRVHVITDGRDVLARSALTWVRPLEELLAACSRDGLDYAVASGGGRMLMTMDRYEADWEMVARGWRCHVLGQGRAFASASAAIETLYEEDPEVDDQYMPAFVVEGSEGAIVDGDAVLFFNFRGDRALEITRAFEQKEFPHFDRERRPDVFYAGMMQYDGDLKLPTRFLVPPPAIDRCVGEFLAVNGLRTFACSETQKYGHVTYFYNGNRSGYVDDQLEKYVEIPSDNVSFDERPWMKAAEISDAAVEAIASGSYDVVRLNYPNGDMVGHTGDLEATRIAIEVVDRQLERLEKAVKLADGVLLITADHGNADEMFSRNKKGEVKRGESGEPLARTSHTTNVVPLIVVDPQGRLRLVEGLDDAGVANLGATVIELCGLTAPPGYLPGLLE